MRSSGGGVRPSGRLEVVFWNIYLWVCLLHHRISCQIVKTTTAMICNLIKASSQTPSSASILTLFIQCRPNGELIVLYWMTHAPSRTIRSIHSMLKVVITMQDVVFVSASKWAARKYMERKVELITSAISTNMPSVNEISNFLVISCPFIVVHG